MTPPRMHARPQQQRHPLRPLELALSLAIALELVLVNAIAVAHIPPLQLDSTGPLGLVFHDKSRSFTLLALLVVVALAATRLPALGRAAALVFVGAAIANFVSPHLWSGGTPDYLVFHRLEIIANVPDLVMLVAVVVIVGSILFRAARRLTAGP